MYVKIANLNSEIKIQLLSSILENPIESKDIELTEKNICDRKINYC